MRVQIESNFVIPGIPGDDLEVEKGVTLRGLLGEIMRRAEGTIDFFHHGSDRLEAEDWEIDVNGVPYHACDGQLERILTDGDVITVRIVPIGGG